MRRIVEAFGDWVSKPDGTLDRAAVSAVIFKDPSKRELINSLLHPLIIAEQDELLARWETEDPRGVGVVDAALMIESGGHVRFDKLVVVHCRPEVQLERLMRRNGYTREEAAARIGAQMPQEEKLRYADFKIDTSGGFDETRRRTEQVYAELRRLADESGREENLQA